MRLTRKKLWLIIAFFATVGLITMVALKSSPTPAKPQVITLPNGDKYEFAGVLYGTRVVLPKWDHQLISRLPAPLAKFVVQSFGMRGSYNSLAHLGGVFAGFSAWIIWRRLHAVALSSPQK